MFHLHNTAKYLKIIVITITFALTAAGCGSSSSPEDPPAVNNAPVISSSAVTQAVVDEPYSYTLTASDSDGDSLTYSATGLSGWLNFDTTTAVLSGTPASGDVGDISITLTVSDGTDSVEQTFTITVEAVNNAPSITSTAGTTAVVGTAYSYTLTATDADGDPLTMSADTLPAWMDFDAGTGVLSGTPTNAEIGVHSVTLSVTDGEDSDSETFDLTVSDVTATSALTIFEDTESTDWPAWDCCGGSTPAVVDDGGSNGATMEFAISGSTVVGFTSRAVDGGAGVPFDATAIATDGTFQFDLKMVTAPTAGSTDWKLKVESNGGAGGQAIEVNLSTSQENHAEPVLDTWQHYTFDISVLGA